MSLKYIESSLRGVQHAGAWSLGGGRTCAHLVCSNQTHKLVIQPRQLRAIRATICNYLCLKSL
jgi:hypothetical protein